VPHTKLACRNCWLLLPENQRTAVVRARGDDRLRVVGEALAWYRAHVHYGRLIADEPAEVWYMIDDGRPGR
jgi:hypothetical protein